LVSDRGVGDPLVVVVAYHADEHLRLCLTALGGQFSVVVVDNSPAVETTRIVEAAGARYVKAPGNLGFAAGVNLGLTVGWDQVSDVLLLNPDARATPPDVRALSAALQRDPQRAAVGPNLIGEGGKPQKPEWPMPSPTQIWLDAVGLGRLWRGRRFVVGAALLLSGAALAELGGLDERYFLYAEEADWQLTAQHRGWSVSVIPEVTVLHVGGASSGDPTVRETFFHASHEAFGRKWYGPVGWTVMRTAAMLAALRRGFIGPQEGRRAARRVLNLYWRGPAKRARLLREGGG
jgi:GT2 family glycosyltransferase